MSLSSSDYTAVDLTVSELRCEFSTSVHQSSSAAGPDFSRKPTPGEEPASQQDRHISTMNICLACLCSAFNLAG
jgi:hypothetical protein